MFRSLTFFYCNGYTSFHNCIPQKNHLRKYFLGGFFNVRLACVTRTLKKEYLTKLVDEKIITSEKRTQL